MADSLSRGLGRRSRAPRSRDGPHVPRRCAAAGATRGTRADAHGSAERLEAADRLLGPGGTGPGRAAPGAVRLDGDAADRRWPRAADDPSALAGAAAGPGHTRSRQLL